MAPHTLEVTTRSTAAGARQQPYVGPQAFSREDVQAGRELHGRDRDVNGLVDLLISQRIVVLHSPSGAGKTSLIHARLIPALEAEQFYVLPVVRVGLEPGPQTDPPAVAGSGNRYVRSTLHCLGSTSAADLPTWFDQLTLEPTELPLLIFDQFEEILTADPTDRAAKEEFFNQLGSVLRNRGRWALIAMREDFVSALEPYVAAIPTRLSHRYRLDLLDESAALAAVTKPAAKAGVPFDPAAARELVDELRLTQVQRPDGHTDTVKGPYVEPVQLQVVCYSLWQRLPSDVTEITSDHVHRFGDVNQALTDFYEGTLSRTARETHVGVRELRQWFSHQLITTGSTRGLVYRGGTDTGHLPNKAVDVLEREHLIRAETRAGARWYELIHDRFIQPILVANAAWERRRMRRRVLWPSVVIGVVLAVVAAASFLSSQESASQAQRAHAEATAVGAALDDNAAQLLEVAATTFAAAAAATATVEADATVQVRRTPPATRTGVATLQPTAPPGPTSAAAPTQAAAPTIDPGVDIARATPGGPSASPTRVAATPTAIAVAANPGPERLNIGRTVGGESLDVLRVGNGPRRIAIVGAMHGGEELAAYNLLVDVKDRLVAGSLKVPPELTLYLLPTLDPDDLGPKTGFNRNLVDLNRNFPIVWVPMTCGSPTGYRYRQYGGCKKDGGGSKPGSEPETQAAMLLVTREQLSAVVILNSGLSSVSSRNGGGGWGENLGRAIGEQFLLEFMISCCRTYPVSGQFVDWVESRGLTGVEVNAPDAQLAKNGTLLIDFVLDRLRVATCTPTAATGEFALHDAPSATSPDHGRAVYPGEEVTVRGWAPSPDSNDPWLLVDITRPNDGRSGWMYTRETNDAQPHCDFDLGDPGGFTFPRS